MSETSRSKGPILRKLKEESGDKDCAVSIITTRADLDGRVVGEGAHAGMAVGNALFTFQASSFRECLPDSDLWEFRITEKGPKGDVMRSSVYISGDDIFLIQVASAIGL